VSSLSPSALDPSPSPGLGEALARASRLVSNRTGIVSDVRFMETTPAEPAVYWAQSQPAVLTPLAGRPALNDGNGVSVDPQRAAMKALGESVERYCCAFYDPRDLWYGTYDGLPGRAVRPEDFAFFSAAQYSRPDFPFAPFTRRTHIGWVIGHSLLEDCATWVPASSVYIPYDRADLEPPLSDLISTGLACGPTLANALLKGLTEAVERDAYSIVWQHRLARPHIDLESLDDPFLRSFVDRLTRLNIQVRAVLLTLDIQIPVVLVLMTREDGPPWTVVASGADLSPRHALLLALEEACLALIGMGRAVAVAADFVPEPDYSNLTTLMQHGVAHAIDPRLRTAVDFLKTPTQVVHLADLRDVATGNAAVDLRTALSEIRPLVSDVVGVDVTTPDVDDLGFKVARVIVPDLQRMDMNHQYRHLGGRRLYDVPWKLRLISTPRGEGDLNPEPHPFP
jgi:ribosomal protein S12 methylthiotransferase accessory factor